MDDGSDEEITEIDYRSPTRKSPKDSKTQDKEWSSPNKVEKNRKLSEHQQQSPDRNCSICLARFNNKAFTDSCFHAFCFTCIHEWANIKLECPLCKRPFKTIIYDVKSYNDFKQFHFPNRSDLLDWDGEEGGDRRFRYRSTLTGDRVRERRHRQQNEWQRQFARQHDHSYDTAGPSTSTGANNYAQMPWRVLRDFYQFNNPPPPMLPSTSRSVEPPRNTITTRLQWRTRRERATSEWRRRVYCQDLWVIPEQSRTRYRQTSAAFFRKNPACIHRLIPWLNRELNVLLYNDANHVVHVIDIITEVMKRFDINSDDFYIYMQPYFNDRTRHFQHEFYHFARSQYDMTKYDSMAQYPGASHENHTVSVWDTSSDSDDDPLNRLNRRSCQDHGESQTAAQFLNTFQTVPTQQPPAERRQSSLPDITPLMTEVRNFLASTRASNRDTGHSGWDSPTPAPVFSPTPKRQATQRHVKTPEHVVVDQNSDTDVDVDSSDGSVYFIKAEKPWAERSPVELSGDSSPEIQVLSQTKPAGPDQTPPNSLSGSESSYCYLDPPAEHNSIIHSITSPLRNAQKTRSERDNAHNKKSSKQKTPRRKETKSRTHSVRKSNVTSSKRKQHTPQSRDRRSPDTRSHRKIHMRLSSRGSMWHVNRSRSRSGSRERSHFNKIYRPRSSSSSVSPVRKRHHYREEWKSDYRNDRESNRKRFKRIHRPRSSSSSASPNKSSRYDRERDEFSRHRGKSRDKSSRDKDKRKRRHSSEHGISIVHEVKRKHDRGDSIEIVQEHKSKHKKNKKHKKHKKSKKHKHRHKSLAVSVTPDTVTTVSDSDSGIVFCSETKKIASVVVTSNGASSSMCKKNPTGHKSSAKKSKNTIQVETSENPAHEEPKITDINAHVSTTDLLMSDNENKTDNLSFSIGSPGYDNPLGDNYLSASSQVCHDSDILIKSDEFLSGSGSNSEIVLDSPQKAVSNNFDDGFDVSGSDNKCSSVDQDLQDYLNDSDSGLNDSLLASDQ